MNTIEKDTNKINAYTCGSCGQNTVIKHREPGVTPMFLNCFHCGGNAISHMYKVPQDLEHHLVAFKPQSKAEWKLYKKYLKSYYKNEPRFNEAVMHDMIEASKKHCDDGGVIMVDSNTLQIN